LGAAFAQYAPPVIGAMNSITTFLFALGGLMVAALGKVLSEEVHTCLPLVTKWLLEKAVLTLPVEAREAFAKRVVRKLNSWPGKFGRFIISLWLVWESRDAFSAHIHANLNSPDIDLQYVRRTAKRDIVILFILLATLPIPLIMIHWHPYVSTTNLMSRLFFDLMVAFIAALILFLFAPACVRYKLASDLIG
jgi:hypothetical protein